MPGPKNLHEFIQYSVLYLWGLEVSMNMNVKSVILWGDSNSTFDVPPSLLEKNVFLQSILCILYKVEFRAAATVQANCFCFLISPEYTRLYSLYKRPHSIPFIIKPDYKLFCITSASCSMVTATIGQANLTSSVWHLKAPKLRPRVFSDLFYTDPGISGAALEFSMYVFFPFPQIDLHHGFPLSRPGWIPP